MAKEYKPGFIYIRSDLLKQEIAMSEKTGIVFCEDFGPDGQHVQYSPKEIEILARDGGVLSPQVHAVKRILGGEVVERTGADNAGKRPAGESAESIDDASSLGGKVAGAAKNGAGNENGELDIY
jgi:hypothetical protein